MSLKAACDVKSPQTTFTTGNIRLERIFWKQEENERYRKSKGQSIMDNPEILTTPGTQDTGRK